MKSLLLLMLLLAACAAMPQKKTEDTNSTVGMIVVLVGDVPKAFVFIDNHGADTIASIEECAADSACVALVQQMMTAEKYETIELRKRDSNSGPSTSI
jgi:Na+-transporting NADH:ubiquinone oxidoreductase subunit NqrD